ncbi:MAG: hypothetical protein AAFR24_08155 [Cyanobacteria bacterium J06627_3]
MNIQRNKERIREIQQITGLQPTHFAALSRLVCRVAPLLAER